MPVRLLAIECTEHDYRLNLESLSILAALRSIFRTLEDLERFGQTVQIHGGYGISLSFWNVTESSSLSDSFFMSTIGSGASCSGLGGTRHTFSLENLRWSLWPALFVVKILLVTMHIVSVQSMGKVTNRSVMSDLPKKSIPRFRDTAIASSILDAPAIDTAETIVRSQCGFVTLDPADLDAAISKVLVEQGKLTQFQAEQILAGRRKLTLGQYRILDAIAQGGMGQVFKAEHVMMGRIVAIKVLPRAKSTPETESAFQREIRALGRLDHDNLVRAFDAGHDGKVYYMVTELVPGLDLRRQVLRYGPIDEKSAASIISQAAAGLAHAHVAGLVHRDVKPGNLLVTDDGRVKVSDLGLAGSLLDDSTTKLGRVVGTVDYMAPEQIRSPDEAGPPADIYGLGCTLYFALTGQVPFPGGTRQEKARRHLKERPTPIRELAPKVSAAFVDVVEAMMQKNPMHRLNSAEAVIERLRRWAPTHPIPMSRSTEMIKKRDSKRSPPPLPSAVTGSDAALSQPPHKSDGSSPPAVPSRMPHMFSSSSNIPNMASLREADVGSLLADEASSNNRSFVEQLNIFAVGIHTLVLIVVKIVMLSAAIGSVMYFMMSILKFRQTSSQSWFDPNLIGVLSFLLMVIAFSLAYLPDIYRRR